MTPRRRRARKAISLREQLAAALFELLPYTGAHKAQLRELKVPAKSIIALWEMHHIEFFALGGSDRWWNIHPMLKAAHRERSGKDTTTIAHVKRVAKVERYHREAMKAKRNTGPDTVVLRRNADGTPFRLGRWPSRKLRSRSSFQQKNRE